MGNSPVGTIYLLKRAELSLRTCVEFALHEFELTPVQFLMLMLLRDRAALCGAELARAMGVRPQSLTETLLALEERKLVERTANPTRRRALQARLTPPGNQLLTQALQVAQQIEAELLAGVSPAEITKFQRLLASLSERAEQRSGRHRLSAQIATS